MKKLVLSFLFFLLLSLSACSAQAEVPPARSLSLEQEGIAPYTFSEHETSLFKAFGLDRNTALIVYKAPPEAKYLGLRSHILQTDGTWASTLVTEVYNGEDLEPKPLAGSISLLFQPDGSMDVIVKDKVLLYSTQMPALDVNRSSTGWNRPTLDTFTELTLNKDIPIAMNIRVEGEIYPHPLSDFYTPAVFLEHEHALVQVLTVTVSAERSSAS